MAEENEVLRQLEVLFLSMHKQVRLLRSNLPDKMDRVDTLLRDLEHATETLDKLYTTPEGDTLKEEVVLGEIRIKSVLDDDGSMSWILIPDELSLVEILGMLELAKDTAIRDRMESEE